jgi:hypothetical protein
VVFATATRSSADLLIIAAGPYKWSFDYEEKNFVIGPKAVRIALEIRPDRCAMALNDSPFQSNSIFFFFY